MSDELLNILFEGNKDIDNQKLLDYISDKLPADEKYELEKNMVDSDMMNDVIEGLEKFKDKKEVAAFVEQLNAHLKKQLEKKKAKKIKRELKNPAWVYFSVILVIIIILIGFFVIRKYLENKKTSKPATTAIIQAPK